MAAGDAVTAVEQYYSAEYLGTGMTFFTANGETIDMHGGSVNKRELIRLEADPGWHQRVQYRLSHSAV